MNEKSSSEDNEGWTTIHRKKAKTKTKNLFAGKRGKALVSPSSNFKAADKRVPLFIYNVSKDTTVDDVAKYIREKTKVLVSPVKVIPKGSKNYDSYKLYVPSQKLALFDDDSLWPDGICFRRYIVFKQKETQIDPDTNSTNKNGE